jgi:hypothetical protein
MREGIQFVTSSQLPVITEGTCEEIQHRNAEFSGFVQHSFIDTSPKSLSTTEH